MHSQQKSETLNKCTLLAYAFLFSSVFWAFPIFRFGVWDDVTPTISATLLAGAFMWFKFAHIPNKISTLELPLPIRLWLLNSIWMALCSLFAQYPILSLFGAPQLGEGAFLFWACGGIMLVSFHLQSNETLIRTVCILLLAIIFICTLVTQWGNNTPFHLFSFPDYLGLYAVFIPFLADKIATTTNKLKQRRAHFTLLGFAMGLAAAYVSDNRAALLILFICGFGIWGISYLISKRFSWLSLCGVIAAFSIPFLSLAIISYVGQTYIPKALGEHTTLYSLWGRYLMFDVATHEFWKNSWSLWLTGIGFGHSIITSQEYLTFTGQSFINPTWDTFIRDFIHTHSIPLEIAISGGIPALLLYLSALASWIYFVNEKDRPIILATSLSYIALASIWFQLIVIAPLLAFTIGISLKQRPTNSPQKSKGSKVFAYCISCTLVGAASYHLYSNTLLDRDFFTKGQSVIHLDHRQGHIAFKQAFAEAYHEIAKPNAKAEDYDWFNHLWQQYREDMHNAQGPILAIGGMIVTSDLIYNDQASPEYKKLQSQALENWSRTAKLVIQQAPHRVDLLVPYLNYASSEKATPSIKAEARQVISSLKEHSSHNPIAMWFDGLLKLEKAKSVKHKLRAIRSMLRAVKRHNLRRYLDIPESLEKELVQARKALITIEKQKKAQN